MRPSGALYAAGLTGRHGRRICKLRSFNTRFPRVMSSFWNLPTELVVRRGLLRETGRSALSVGRHHVWVDAETSLDFVNFGSVAKSIAELITQANRKPLSIGVSGPWGVGKSSLIKLTRAELELRQTGAADDDDPPPSKYVFVDFNAWLYQGYDDARAALMEAIATELTEVANQRKTGVQKTQEFLSRINWFRLAALTGGSAAALAFGLPPIGLVAEGSALWARARETGVDGELIEDTEKLAKKAAKKTKGLIEPKTEESPPQRIQALRTAFEDSLKELDVTLVVLIDDLDRCLPETAVSTLEAIRLFLFLDGTAFVIAADDQMIKHAVRRHFDQPDDALVTNYFDKLIQIPIRVPTLGTQEVRAYMFLLYVEHSELPGPKKEAIRLAVCDRLANSWQGLRIDSSFIQSVQADLPATLVAQLDTAERLTTIMTTASGIAGNPRLIKRFLNALSVRMAVANSQGVAVNEAALAKLLLFERLAPPDLYLALATDITNSSDGKPHMLRPWEPNDKATAEANAVSGETQQSGKAEEPQPASPDGASKAAGASREMPDDWNTEFVKEWLALPPRLSEIDMRGALYVSREYLPIVTSEDGLTSAAAELLKALIEHPSEAGSLGEQLRGLSGPELNTILGRLLDLARNEESWGVPDVLHALLAIVRSAPTLGTRLSGFLGDRPPNQIEPDLIPLIHDEEWAVELMERWTADDGIHETVKAAIGRRTQGGNVAKQ